MGKDVVWMRVARRAGFAGPSPEAGVSRHQDFRSVARHCISPLKRERRAEQRLTVSWEAIVVAFPRLSRFLQLAHLESAKFAARQRSQILTVTRTRIP